MPLIQVGAQNWDGDNGAGRVVLYDSHGVAISRAQGEARAAGDEFLPVGGVNDDTYRALRTDRMGNVGLATNTTMFSEPFEGTTIATHRLTVAATTFTPAQTLAGGLNLNSGNVTTAASAVLVTTNRRFVKLQRAPLHFKARARLGHVANAVMELGFGNPAAQVNSPTVGAYWQVTAGGVVQPVLTFSGVDVAGPAASLGSGWQNNFYTFDVILDDDEAWFGVQDTSTGVLVAERRIQLPVTQARLWDATRLSAFARLHFPTAPAAAATMILTSLDVLLLDTALNKPWPHLAAHMGLDAATNPSTIAQAAQWANSAAPASATLSNTAAGYGTLGGLFQFAAPGGAATDFALFGFQVPAPYSFVCTGVDIDTWNTGAAVATTPTLMVWGLSADQAAVSLATGGNRRIGLGAQTLAVGAPIGARADRAITVDLANGPMVTNPGRFLVVMLRVPVGTATASQIVQGLVTLKGYFE
jgi:hypothetical protein